MYNKFYGITHDSKTKNYMLVFCEKCHKVCNAIYFQHNFGSWTSGNNDIEKFIKNTQLLAHDNSEGALEWISYNRFYDNKYIGKGEFGKVFRANWIDGYIDKWDNKDQNWKRKDQNMFVIIKSFNNPNNVTLEFINKVIMDLLFSKIFKILMSLMY